MSDQPEIVHIEWSEQVVVEVDGAILSVFQRDSYAARVTFEDKQTVIVALPIAARRTPLATWRPKVEAFARELRASDQGVGAMDSGIMPIDNDDE